MSPLSKIMANRLFVVCGFTMLIMAVVMSPLESATRRWVSKRPVQLRKPVQELDPQSLTGLTYKADAGIDILAEETADYIVWFLDPAGGREPVGLVVFGDTHYEVVCHYDGVLLVNPGSPTYPGRKRGAGRLGTLALLEICRGIVNVRMVDLEA